MWQRRYWEHVIRNDEDYKNHMDYIHYNPVKHGYVERAAEWKYCSFQHFVHQGYYAKDSLTYLKNIVDLLQIIYDIMNNSVYIACYELENSNTDIPNPQASFNQLLEIYVQDSLELKMDGERLYINFNVRGSREEQFDFKLNLKKVIEEKAHKQAFFIDHLKEYYYSYDLILEKITEKK